MKPRPPGTPDPGNCLPRDPLACHAPRGAKDAAVPPGSPSIRPRPGALLGQPSALAHAAGRQESFLLAVPMNLVGWLSALLAYWQEALPLVTGALGYLARLLHERHNTAANRRRAHLGAIKRGVLERIIKGLDEHYLPILGGAQACLTITTTFQEVRGGRTGPRLAVVEEAFSPRDPAKEDLPDRALLHCAIANHPNLHPILLHYWRFLPQFDTLRQATQRHAGALVDRIRGWPGWSMAVHRAALPSVWASPHRLALFLLRLKLSGKTLERICLFPPRRESEGWAEVVPESQAVSAEATALADAWTAQLREILDERDDPHELISEYARLKKEALVLREMCAQALRTTVLRGACEFTKP